MNPPRAFRSHDGLGTWICVSKIFSQMVVVKSGDESHGKTQKKSPLNKPQGMVYISSFGQFPSHGHVLIPSRCFLCPHQSQLLQLPPELEKMTNLDFVFFEYTYGGEESAHDGTIQKIRVKFSKTKNKKKPRNP